MYTSSRELSDDRCLCRADAIHCGSNSRILDIEIWEMRP